MVHFICVYLHQFLIVYSVNLLHCYVDLRLIRYLNVIRVVRVACTYKDNDRSGNDEGKINQPI